MTFDKFIRYVGVENICDDIAIMLGEDHRPGKFWKICWQYISPLILVVINNFVFCSSEIEALRLIVYVYLI